MIAFNCIYVIQLITPVLGRKINGAGLTSRKAYRGHYVVEGFGKCRVFLFGDEGPYIILETSEETVLIMFYDSNRTLELYEYFVENIDI